MADRQEKNGLIDYHPLSNKVVRDLVHPGLYSYVADISPLRAKVTDIEPCVFPESQFGLDALEDQKDFWARG